VLTETSYHMAIYVYVGAACVMLAYLAWWLGRHWPAGVVALIVLVLAALLLTPAYPKEGVDTMAPALIVAAFQIFTRGVAAADHALRPLLFMSGIAVAIGLLLAVTVFRRRKPRRPQDGKPRRAGT